MAESILSPAVIAVLIIAVLILECGILYRRLKVSRGLGSGNCTLAGIAATVAAIVFSLIASVLILLNALSNGVSCEANTYMMFIFYCVYKILWYFFLIEKVYTVSTTRRKIARSQDITYTSKFILILGFIGVIVVACKCAIDKIDKRGKCTVSPDKKGLLPLLIYDVVCSLILLVEFLVPLFRSWQNFRSVTILRLVRKNVIAALVCIAFTFANIFMLYDDGGEVIDLTMLYFTLDIAASVIVIHWLLGVRSNKKNGKTSRANSDMGLSLNMSVSIAPLPKTTDLEVSTQRGRRLRESNIDNMDTNSVLTTGTGPDCAMLSPRNPGSIIPFPVKSRSDSGKLYC